MRKIVVVVIFIKINDNSVDHKGQFLKPIDIQMLDFQLPMNKFRLVTMEDGCVQGGFRSAIAEEINLLKLDYPVKQLTLGIPDEFVTHGTVSNLCKELKLDSREFSYQCNSRIQSPV